MVQQEINPQKTRILYPTSIKQIYFDFLKIFAWAKVAHFPVKRLNFIFIRVLKFFLFFVHYFLDICHFHVTKKKISNIVCGNFLV